MKVSQFLCLGSILLLIAQIGVFLKVRSAERDLDRARKPRNEMESFQALYDTSLKLSHFGYSNFWISGRLIRAQCGSECRFWIDHLDPNESIELPYNLHVDETNKPKL